MAKKVAAKKVARFRMGKSMKDTVVGAAPAKRKSSKGKPVRRKPALTAEQRAEKARAKRLAAAKKKLTALKQKQAKQLAAFKAKLAKALEKFETKTLAAVDKPARKKRLRSAKAGMNKQDLIEVIAKRASARRR